MEEISSARNMELAGKEVEAPGKESVIARVPSGQEHSLNVRFVKGTSFDARVRNLCLPRGDRQQTGFDRPQLGSALSAGLIAKLRESNDRVVSWLSASEANARLFLENPAAGLEEAGVGLSRTDQKEIVRCREELSGATVVPPGMELKAMTVKAFPKGEVGKLDKLPGRRASVSKRGCVKE